MLVDDAVTHRMLAPHLARGALFLVVPSALALVWLLLSYLAAMSSPSATGETIESLLGVVIVVLYLAGVAAFLAPAREAIAEHARLVEGGASAGADAARWVRESAAARRLPAVTEVREVGGVEVLAFRQHAEHAMLLVQPYGDDLYIGWTMWRSRSPALLLAHFLRDTFGRLGSGPRFSAELRAASTRALRESVHSLAREAAALASGPRPRPDPAGTEEPPRPVGAGSTPVERDTVDTTSGSRRPAAVGPAHPPAGAADAPWLRVAAHTGDGDGENGWGPPPRGGR